MTAISSILLINHRWFILIVSLLKTFCRSFSEISWSPASLIFHTLSLDTCLVKRLKATLIEQYELHTHVIHEDGWTKVQKMHFVLFKVKRLSQIYRKNRCIQMRLKTPVKPQNTFTFAPKHFGLHLSDKTNIRNIFKASVVGWRDVGYTWPLCYRYPR